LQIFSDTHEVPKVDERTLRILAEAVRELIEAKEIGPELGLSYLLWTPPEILAAAKQRASESGPYFYSEATRKRGLALLAEGFSQREVGEALGGIPRTTIAQWVSRDRRERGEAPSGLEAMPEGFRRYWKDKAESAA
jgi:Homeodomain-like domain